MSTSLNFDQTKALNFLIPWYRGLEPYAVLDGPGGTGKSFLVKFLLQRLKVKTLLLAPTHEALKQLREKVGDNEFFEYKTVAAALGISPTTSEKDLKFEHIRLPSMWENFQFCILDEASMTPGWQLKLLMSTGVKILFVGHKSQLPPVEERRKLLDKCVSPVFEKGFPTTTLNIPMRNMGKLWKFTQELENRIYSKTTKVSNEFDVKREFIKTFLKSEEGRVKLLAGDLKVIAWTNREVNRYSQICRKVIHGEVALTVDYLPNDRLLLTAPLASLSHLHLASGASLRKLDKTSSDVKYFYSNSKMSVIGEREPYVVKLFKDLHVECFRVPVDIEGEKTVIYCARYPAQLKLAEDFYEKLAWSKSSVKEKEKAYRERHFALSCFAKVSYAFAGTAHRFQGSTIPEVIIGFNDIVTNPCFVEQAKCLYVAASRASSKLMIYRGI